MNVKVMLEIVIRVVKDDEIGTFDRGQHLRGIRCGRVDFIAGGCGVGGISVGILRIKLRQLGGHHVQPRLGILGREPRMWVVARMIVAMIIVVMFPVVMLLLTGVLLAVLFMLMLFAVIMRVSVLVMRGMRGMIFLVSVRSGIDVREFCLRIMRTTRRRRFCGIYCVDRTG